ncbi:KR-domain-containing protein [Xylaria sp. FL0064]|nr:KR-domain-containing protein [Xylaria sp. FL0064]
MTISNLAVPDSFYWEEDIEYHETLAGDEIEIAVEAIGINFRDVLVAFGRFDSPFGVECAGTVTRVGTHCRDIRLGDRVCAVIDGCARTYARCHYELPAKIPPDMTMAEAASLSATGVTAYHSLITLANLKKEETIPIHSAAGGTGQMALQIAQTIGAEIFVTVGTMEKRMLMKEVYGLSDSHIFYSRDTSFSRDIHRATNGRGVDVVLNSLAGDLLLASWECVAPLGRFIELGKADIEANSKLPMSHFRKNVTFYAVAIDSLSLQQPLIIGKALKAIMNLISQKVMRTASPLNTHPISEVETALRTMQSGKNVGKAVLVITTADKVPTLLLLKYSCRLDPTATYIIAGGLGGLGRSATRWMCQRGARNFILLSRSGPSSPAAQELLRELRGLGASVETPKCDVSNSASLSAALHQCSHMPPIKGCFTWNLHKQLPDGLSFFVILSSVAGIAGSMGQSNYAAGNTYQDGLAHHRLCCGEKAISIDLGWMGDVGIIAENEHLAKGKEAAGDLAKVYETEFLALLDRYCNPSFQPAKSQDAQPIIGIVTPAQFQLRGIEVPEWMTERPLLRTLERFEPGEVSELDSRDRRLADQGDRDWGKEFSQTTSIAEATNIVVEALIQRLSKATSIEPGDINRTRPLHTYGVDSLLAVELRNWFGKIFMTDITIFDIVGQGSLEQIAEDAANRSSLSRSN